MNRLVSLIFIFFISQGIFSQNSDCPDDLNGSPGNSGFTIDLDVYNSTGDFVETITCDRTGGSSQVECDLSPYPSSYFFILTIKKGNQETDCFYDGNGEVLPTTPLAVSFNEFIITHTKDYNTLNWSTLDEKDNDFFTLEYSLNGNYWEHLTEIEGNGTTNSASNYSYEHRINGYNNVYYRLSQTDYDGTTTELAVKAVQNNKYEPVKLAINKDVLFISSKELIKTVQIIDLAGNVVFNQDQVNTENESVQLDFNNGVYIAHVTDQSGNQQSQKFIIQ